MASMYAIEIANCQGRGACKLGMAVAAKYFHAPDYRFNSRYVGLISSHESFVMFYLYIVGYGDSVFAFSHGGQV